MNKHLLFFCIILTFHLNYSQVGIGTVNPEEASILDISATDKGVLIPRVNIEDLSTITPITNGTPESLLVYNTNSTTGKGFYFWNSNNWTPILDGNTSVTNNLYTGNGNLTGPRTIFQGANNLRFYSQGGSFRVSSNTIDNALHINGVHGRIGINTAFPTTRLDINGDLRIRGLVNYSSLSTLRNLVVDDIGRVGYEIINPSDNTSIYANNGIIESPRTIFQNGYNLRFNTQGASFRVSSNTLDNALHLSGVSSGIGLGVFGSQLARLSIKPTLYNGRNVHVSFLGGTNGNNTSWYLGGQGFLNNDLVFRSSLTTGDNRLVLKYGGNIGVNVAEPTAKLDVNGRFRVRDLPNSIGLNVLMSDSNGNIGKKLISNLETNNFYNSNGTITNSRTISQNGNNLRFNTQGGNFRVSSSTIDNAFFVDGPVGYIGINTNTPTTGLDVNGNVRVRNIPISTATNVLVADNSGNIGSTDISTFTNLYNINGSLTSPRIISQGTNDLSFNSQGGNFRVSSSTIDNAFFVDGTNGAIGIGTDNPNNTLHLDAGTSAFPVRFETNSNRAGLLLDNTATTGTNNTVEVRFSNFNGTSITNGAQIAYSDVNDATLPNTLAIRNLRNGSINWYTGGASPSNIKMQLDNNANLDVVGDVTANGMLLTSDRRLKTDIKPIKNVASIISLLNPVGYKKKKSLNSENSEYYKLEYGFIAQEVQEILPEIVHKIDEDNKLAIDYNSLIPILIKAMQEQKEENKNLLKEIETIKSKLEDLS